MIFMNSHSSDESEDKKVPESPSPIGEDGSYEIIFDSKGESDSDTAYTVGGYNAYGFSANGSKAPEAPKAAPESHKDTHTPEAKKKNGGKTRTLLLLAVLLFAFSMVFSIVNMTLLWHRNDIATAHTNGNTENPPDPWTNPAPMEVEDIYATATQKVINSVVVINCEGSAGSGVVWASNNEASYILTCYHVIEGESEIRVILYNDSSYYAEIVGTDPRTDIAILKVNTPNLSSITLPNEDSKLKLGQSVIAIGNPLGSLGNTVTNGILSSLSRTVSVQGTTMELIQTNAAVNSGNSGGGLFDLNGQLIGLVNAKVSQNTVEGIGFAIPYQTLNSVCSELLDKGYVSGRPSMGITAVTITSTNYREVLQNYPDLESYAVKTNKYGPSTVIGGMYIIDTSSVAGYGEGSETLQFGDRLTGVGTSAVSSANDVTTALNDYNAGDTVEITVVRNNKTVVIELVLGEAGK